jgi:type II secretory ATPase GspE/PulE/Tfp pilus assembly ATPase PilB-like protein
MESSQLLAAAVQVGQYISIWKMVPILIVLLIWARLLTWADKDSVDAHLPRQPLNAAFLGGMIAALALFLMVPGFPLALAVFMFVMVAEVATYLILRQQKVGLGDLSKQFNDWMGGFGRKGPKVVEAAVGEVMLHNKSGSTIAPPDSESPDLAGFLGVQSILTAPMRLTAESLHMAPQENAAAVRYSVDGVTYNGATLDKNASAAAITYLKTLSGMDTADKRKPQSGKMKVTVDGKKHDLELKTAGSTAGESLWIEFDPKKRHHEKIDEIGFSTEQLQTLERYVQDLGGIVLVSAPKNQGLTSLIYSILRRHDAFLTHIVTLEHNPDLDLEGITQTPLPAGATPQEEAKQAEWLISQEPHIFMIDKIEDPKTALAVVRHAAAGKRAYVGMRASSTFDALSQWRKLVGDDKVALKHLRLVINGRLVRKLCMACKVGYTADPETLRKLNMSPEKATKLFQARTQPMLDQKGNPMPCDFCHDLRYKGRVGVFEMFEIDDEVRQVLLAGGSVNQLKQLFRKQRRRYMQEMALARVESGDTSVQEVLRVLKATDSGSATPPAPAAPKRK